ncbi:MAG: electron transport complex subunit E [Buchnera aphidicola (Acyrthosiphon caraganae)]|nr:MAG: electron transport complex subunit E [Buchnera aphidicola (Acyrthosiphon caraganae)]
MNIKYFLNNRLWRSNSSLVQLLGLCPVLAMTTNSVNAIGLGVTTTLVLTITNTIISIFKNLIPKNLRIPIYMMIISSIVTSIEMLLHAYQFNLYQSLGIFIPLIVTNCIIVGRADLIAYKSSIIASFFDGIFIGLGSTCAMFIVASIREILGNGTLFFGLNKIISNIDSSIFITLLDKKYTIILAIFPPGGFFVLGFIIAFKNCIDLYYKKNKINNSLKCLCTNQTKKIIKK